MEPTWASRCTICVVSVMTATGFLVFPAEATPQAALYGHPPHEVAVEAELSPAGMYRRTGRVVRLLTPAAEAFKHMREKARLEGVELVPISGFRDYSYQKRLFERAVKRYGSREEAARWVAPPGHSEHHTGLAVDLGDGDAPECDVEPCFERTRAFEWLREKAEGYGFELSFPETTGSPVSYEPWHWRFMAGQ